jgi:hypothetical protein
VPGPGGNPGGLMIPLVLEAHLLNHCYCRQAPGCTVGRLCTKRADMACAFRICSHTAFGDVGAWPS